MKPFSFVIIPDTQYVSADHPETLNKMTRWIQRHIRDLNIRMILHVGDVVDQGALDVGQYQRHQAAFAPLYQTGCPLITAIGNHDYDNLLKENRASTLFNQYCGLSLIQHQPWFGGAYESDKAENLYGRLTIDSFPFLFLSLEFGPRDEVLDWANTVIEQHSDHRVILVTHSYMSPSGTRTKPGDRHNPKHYPGAPDANDGEDVWEKCVRRHPNLFAVFSGHHIPDNVSYRVDLGDHGNPVFQSFQNWQYTENGGEGRIRLMTFDSDRHLAKLSVFNPWQNRVEDEPGYTLSIPFGTQPTDHVHLRYP